MLVIFFLLSGLCLLGLFALATFSEGLVERGDILGGQFLEKNSRYFYYYSFHKLLFRKKIYRLLFSALRLTDSALRLLFGMLFILTLFILLAHASFVLFYTLCALLLFFIFGNFLPRVIASRREEKSLLWSASVVSFFLYLFSPLFLLFLFLESLITLRRKENEEILFEENIKEVMFHILQDIEIKEPLSMADRKLIESVVQFKDRIVREIMVPRVDLFTLSDETSLRSAAYLLAKEGYSRVPIYKETVDNITGVLYVKDLIALYMECELGKKEWNSLDVPVATLAKKAFYTPETKKVAYLLQELRAKQVHMAIVVDEYGGTEGVITIEDILEEIVGEIGDEYDVGEEMPYTPLAQGGWIVGAHMNISDAEEAFSIDIPQEGDYDTLGGYIFHVVKTIPPKGYVLQHENFDIEILHSTERSVEKVKIIPKKSEES